MPQTLQSRPTADPPAFLRYGQPQLDALFHPKTVAVVGASEQSGSVGRTLFENLALRGFSATVYPVHPSRSSILGVTAYGAVNELPEPVDLAVVATPAATVPDIVRQCVDAGTRSVVVISAGFRETGPAGVELERRIQQQIRRGRMPLVGPNCLGVMNPHNGLNATFAANVALPGSVGFISQSGALCTAILDWSLRERVGFSTFVSIGSMLDVNWGDMISHLGSDPHTRSIVLYMESVGDPRAFLSAAREVALTKPIIVMKAGRSEAAAQAAASHTGTLTGSDEVLDAAFRRCGVLRVNTIAELFYMAEILSRQPAPRGPRLTVLTNAGGPGVLAADAVIAEGGKLAELSPQSVDALDAFLPAHWSGGNPIDILGDADPERYAGAARIAAQDPNSDGLLVVLAPQGMTSPTQVAERVAGALPRGEKPLLASWMGGQQVAEGEALLNAAGLATFSYPDTAARLFAYMWRYVDNLKGLYETPVLRPDGDVGDSGRAAAEAILRSARSQGRTLLTETESKALLAAYGMPVIETHVARDAEEAVHVAEALGYPVVVKLNSESVTHKAKAGGVHLHLKNAAEVRQAFEATRRAVERHCGAGHFQGVSVQPMVTADGQELILGSSIDPQFGPVLLFGSGGRLVEIHRDRALGLPPLNSTLARRMMQQTRIYAALQGAGEAPEHRLQALEALLVRFSHLIVEQPWIRELDINPLHVSGEQFTVLDARVLLHPSDSDERTLPGPVISSYPKQYAWSWVGRDGVEVAIRPIRPEDEPMMVELHKALSERSVYNRFFHLMRLGRRIAHDRLRRICFIDYDREIALVAERASDAGGEAIMGVGRLTRIRGTHDAEFAVLVRDDCQRQGIGTQLMRRLIDVARREKIQRLVGEILQENWEMQRLCQKLGFRMKACLADHLVQAVLDLSEQEV